MQSDFVFAYIDSPSCYGTLYEIGYAKGRNKPVAVMFANPKLKNDMWFISESANIVFSNEAYALKAETKSPDIFSAAKQIAHLLYEPHVNKYDLLSNRVKNALKKNGITNESELIARLGKAELIPGIGPKGMFEISTFFDKEVEKWESLF